MKSGNWIFNIKIYLISLFNWDTDMFCRGSSEEWSEVECLMEKNLGIIN